MIKAVQFRAAGLALSALVSCATFTPSLQAQDWAEKYYVGVDAGGAFLPDLKIGQFGIQRTVAGVASFNTTDKAEFDPGIRFGMNAGYHFSDKWAVELESGLLCHSADRFLGIKPGATFNGVNAAQRLTVFGKWFSEVELRQIPVLANLIYRVPTQGRFSPYVGVGAGLVISTLELGEASLTTFGDGAARRVSRYPRACDTDLTFAYQAMAGVKYALSQHMFVDLSYKFLGSTDHNWRIHGDRIRTHPVLSHSVLASFTYRF